MKTKKRNYYGIVFHGGNRTCTTGEPNEHTGNLSIACGIKVFSKKSDLIDWLDKEDLSKPSGLGGGERIQVTKKELRKYCLGDSIKEFKEYLEELEYMLEY